jgi:predicted alpha/beta hydrolase
MSREACVIPVAAAGGPAAVLKGQLVRPDQPAAVAVIIHPATGVPQRHYLAFAEWLAKTEGALVLIYDYRDFGQSANCPVRQSEASMSDWGIADQSAALDWLCAEASDLPIWVVGHSLGALFVPWHAQASRVSRIIAIASGPAHLSRHPWTFLPKVVWFWFIGGPLMTRLFGYMPGRWVGLGADLPAQVYWQWRSWCLSRQFHRKQWGGALPQPDLDAVKADVALIAFADDPMIPPASVRLLAQFYPAARLTYREFKPQDVGLLAIGHVGAFWKRNSALWPALLHRS